MMRRLLASILVAAGLAAGVQAAPAPQASAAGLNCALYLYKPTHYWRSGNWRPVSQGRLSTQEWLDACRGRYRVYKKGPSAPTGPWSVTVRLNGRNCTYTANADLKDWGWWVRARPQVG